ncbi:MAG: HEAT repeat domain-containing protein [bacterium]
MANSNVENQSEEQIHRRQPDYDDVLQLYREQITLGVEESVSGSSADLIEEYESADYERKTEILATLCERNEDDLQSFFETVLSESDRIRLKEFALVGLGVHARDNVTTQVLDEIDNAEDPALLVLGINVLAEVNASDALESLVGYLHHEWDEVKFHSAMALSVLQEIDEELLTQKLREIVEGEAHLTTLYYLILLIKERQLTPATKILHELLDHEKLGYFAIEALGEIGTNGAYEAILPVLDDNDPIRQYYAAEALGKIGNEECWDELESLSENHSDRNVRYYAMRALHRMNRRRSIEVLLDRLRDSDPEIKDYASRALIEFGDVVLEPYREALDSGNREAIKEALYVMGEIGTVDILPELLDKAYSADKEIEHFALEALKKMAESYDECRRYLLEELPTVETELQINIIRVLEGLGNTELCSFLSRFIKADNTKLRYYIVGVCKNESSPECLHQLRRLSEDDNLQVATYAVRTLTSIDSELARELAIEGVKNEIRPLVLLAYLRGFYLDRHPDYLPVAEHTLENTEDSQLRFYAASAIKAIDPDRFEELANGDEYLQRIKQRVYV